MAPNSLNHLLDQLVELKSRFGSREHGAVERILTRLAHKKIADIQALIRFHEILLFLIAYPQSARIRQFAETQLRAFESRIEALRAAELDLSAFDDPEVSGIAGTAVIDTFTYYIVRWLLKIHPARVQFDWDWFDDSNRLAETWPRFVPLLDEDALVEANVPYPEWLRQAKGRQSALPWLLDRFESLGKPDRETAELYDSQNLFVSWTPSYRATRTGMRLPVNAKQIFYHRRPLIQRRDISLPNELRQLGIPPVLLSTTRGEKLLDLAREASTVRYRELYGFTHGDPRKVLHANIGRGVDIFIAGLPRDKRLPLRAYHAAMIFKNGVPVGYFEGLSFFERMESGFNLYYTFREGETAWLYAQTLHIFHHLLGVSVFTLDPYQIGFENEEGIESGAFWFYRKLGFRPTSPELMKLVLKEEKKIATSKGYRTSARTLRKLAESPMIFELEQTNSGDWDRFQLRNIGLAVARRMASKYRGEAEVFRLAAVEKLTRVLGTKPDGFRPAETSALNDFAVALSLIGDLSAWNDGEKRALAQVIRAKGTSDESRYLKLMQRQARLRAAMIKLGSHNERAGAPS
jgi:hypothetical protein